jgi:hypothetical protein
MGSQKNQTAKQLTELLETASLQQLSGLLRIERMQRNRREEGELYFLSGQPIYAQTEKLTGQEALDYLLTWRTFQFSFAADAPQPPANLPLRVAVHPPAKPLEQIVPRRISPEQHARSLPLTRRQRTIYFLINDERTIADLARVTGKTMREVVLILQELQSLGVIAV